MAISTGAAAPALAVRLRQRLERELGPEHATLLGRAASLRNAMLRRWPDFEERRRRWYALVDSPVLRLLRAGRRDAARREVEAQLGIAPP